MDVSTCLPYFGARMSLARLRMFNPEVPLWKCCSMRSFWVSLLLVPGRGKFSKSVDIQIMKHLGAHWKMPQKWCKEYRIAQQNTENWSVFMKHSTEPSKWPFKSLYIQYIYNYLYISLRKMIGIWGISLWQHPVTHFTMFFFNSKSDPFCNQDGCSDSTGKGVVLHPSRPGRLPKTFSCRGAPRI